MNTSARSPLKRKKLLSALVILLTGIMVYAALGFTGEDDFKRAQQQILLRKIGHEILLQSGDSHSLVLPVKKVGDNRYQLRFEKEFSFQPDSLIALTRKVLAKDELATGYVVNVLNCNTDDILYGYAIAKKEPDSIVPCSGRSQPKGCYLVEITFNNSGIVALPRGYLVGGISLFALLGLLLASPFRLRRTRVENNGPSYDTLTISNTLYYPATREIRVDGITTELTPKEARLFTILAGSPNTIVERSRIQKEIWEDEGVIVGRSLDVFVSKLRKKLENDRTIRIVNVHGKGYRLETGEIA